MLMERVTAIIISNVKVHLFAAVTTVEVNRKAWTAVMPASLGMFMLVLSSFYLVKWMCILSNSYFKLARCTMNIDCSNGYICDGNHNFCRIKSNNTDYAFCAEGGTLCTEGEGGCNSDSDCGATLICGTNNCPRGISDLDCCSGNENRNFVLFEQKLVCCMM